jgi:hypothetical protein
VWTSQQLPGTLRRSLFFVPVVAAVLALLAVPTSAAAAPVVVIDAVSDPLIAPGDTGTDVTWHADVDGTYSVRVGDTG